MSRTNEPLKILFVAAEAAPYAMVGGLGQVLHALPRAMRKRGHDVRVMMPKYGKISMRRYPMQRVTEGLQLMPSGRDPHGLTVSNVLTRREKDGSITYFLENMEYYEKRANVYSYADDPVRWMLLSRGTLEFIRRSDWVPDVIVANDWETGFIPNLLATEYADDVVLKNIATVFLIHNMRNQGMFDVHFVQDKDVDLGTTPVPAILDSSVLKLNGMRRGILYADMICAVSPTYAKEILLPELGEKLDKILRKRKARLTGILNGIDMDKYNPATDKLIKHRFSLARPAGRIENKKALQRMFKLPQRSDSFVVGFVGRLDEQKGINLFVQIADAALANLNMQLVLVGTGEKDFRMFFKKLQERYPEQVGVHLYFDDKLPRHIFAGADAILMPSRFEPMGLVQIEALRYGTIPIARQTGGLADTVTDFDPATGSGTGFVFKPYEPMALLIALIRASEAFRDHKEWATIVHHAMSMDFSWNQSAEQHETLCYKALRLHR